MTLAAGKSTDRGNCNGTAPRTVASGRRRCHASPRVQNGGVDPRRFREVVDGLSRQADPQAGYFGPGSLLWRVSREWIVQAGGVRAVLLQLAHPKVAQGVAEHSDFQRAFLRRALNTHRAANELVFGNAATATRRALRLYAMHWRVRSRPGARASAAYSATDSELLMWVYATLIDSTIVIHDTFLGTMRQEDWEEYYQEARLLALLFGIEARFVPEELAALRRWMAGLLASGEIAVTPTALALANALRRGAWPLRLVEPLHRVLAAGSLPPQLRAAYGFADEEAARRRYVAAAALSRAVLPRLPVLLRSTPQAIAAEWRCRHARPQA